MAEEENGKTSKEGVYAGGDAVTGAAMVILAMEAGRAGARGDSWVFDEDFIVGLDLCRKMLIASVIVIPKLENIFSALNFISGSMRILMFALLAILFIAFKAKFLWLIMQRIPHPIQITNQKNPKQKQIMSNHTSPG